TKQKASNAMIKIFNYDFMWSVLTHNNVFGSKRTDMGHAVYLSDRSDLRGKGKPLFTDPEKALKMDPWELYGTVDEKKAIAEYNEHFKRCCIDWPNAVNMTGIYITLISGMIEIFGWDMLLEAAGTDQNAFGDMVNRYAGWISQYFNALAKSDSPVVMIHDDIVWTQGAFIQPAWYRRFVFPNYKKLFAPLREAGKIIMYTSDGNYTQFIDDIAPYVNAFVMEPTTDMAYIAEHYGKTHAFVGNADTRILLSGTKEDIRAEVKRCMDIGKKYPGFFMAVGNHIPENTPLDNVMYYNEVYEELSKR
ncbi:MAG: uroporphyrinogen decarboxylase family protein, partial [Treponema sp.]|nr:uroporphyrinogen decarboxylase family protein [Treponema sp.]